jgi:hypothetical protein
MTIVSTTNKTTRVFTVQNLPQADAKRICDFLQGAVYAWCKDHPDEWFGLRDLMGGENGNWGGTPLQELYDRHRAAGSGEAEAESKAASDGGRLLKRVLHDDGREFKAKRAYRTALYRWVR